MMKTSLRLAVLLVGSLLSLCWGPTPYSQQKGPSLPISSPSDAQALLQKALSAPSNSESPEYYIARSFFIGGNLWQRIRIHDSQVLGLASGFLGDNRPVFTPQDAKNVFSTKALQDLLTPFKSCTPELAAYDDLNPGKYTSFLPFASTESKSFSTFLCTVSGQGILIMVVSKGKLVGIEIWSSTR